MFLQRHAAALAGSMLLITALTACTPAGGPDETPEPTVSMTPPETATATATPTPAPTEEPEAGPLSCDSVIPASIRDTQLALGNTIFGPQEFFDKIRAEGSHSPELLRFEDNGGVVCPWVHSQSVVDVQGYSPLPADQIVAAMGEILASGDFVQSEYAGGSLFEIQNNDETPFRVFHIDASGGWYVATTVAEIDQLRAVTH
jgi:hypothetical protein